MSSKAVAQRERREDIDALGPWFHNIHLPDGRQTAPGHPFGDFPAFKWQRVQSAVPQDLRGWTALDIGCNAGFYAIEMAKRGAHVTAVDVEPLYLDQARWVVEQFGLRSQIDIVEGHVYELLKSAERYDFVWFTGVFYHLKYPALALDLIRRATRRLMMFQTMTMPGEEVVAPPHDLPLDERNAMRSPGWPKMAFIEHKVANDATNWWAPNHACVEALLRAAAFNVVQRPEHEFYLCEPDGVFESQDLARMLAVPSPDGRGLG
jgi:tRNA (mo5U34)-methyltransferase